MKTLKNSFIILMLVFIIFSSARSQITPDNPMGKTWVVFIENSNYETFASLDGPTQDVTLMKSALEKYVINKVIHKKDLTKNEMEDFVSNDLKSQVLLHNVNSVLFWYAGHGKFINKTGYWVPVDAKRDDESTYFDISYLKKTLQQLENDITHVLVITDACESGPTFYQAMRSYNDERSCNDLSASQSKSSQVFQSTGYQLSVNESEFTRTFANTLTNNANQCIPIESIVSKVTIAAVNKNQKKPKFGKIEGLKDEDGTFFFISK